MPMGVTPAWVRWPFEIKSWLHVEGYQVVTWVAVGWRCRLGSRRVLAVEQGKARRQMTVPVIGA